MTTNPSKNWKKRKNKNKKQKQKTKKLSVVSILKQIFFLQAWQVWQRDKKKSYTYPRESSSKCPWDARKNTNLAFVLPFNLFLTSSNKSKNWIDVARLSYNSPRISNPCLSLNTVLINFPSALAQLRLLIPWFVSWMLEDK